MTKPAKCEESEYFINRLTDEIFNGIYDFANEITDYPKTGGTAKKVVTTTAAKNSRRLLTGLLKITGKESAVRTKNQSKRSRREMSLN
jgi:hypothetical protein